MNFEIFKEEHPQLYKNLQTGIGIFCGILILVILFIFSKPFRADFTRKSDILNFLNYQKTNNICKETINEYKELLAMTKTQEKWDISPIINDYIYKIEQVTKYIEKYGKSHGKNIFSVDTQTINEDNINFGYLDNDLSYLISILSDYNDLPQSKDIVYSLMDQLEEIFIHESSFTYKGWYITEEIANKHGNKIQDNQWLLKLPYEVYANFKLSNVQKLNRKYTDVSYKTQNGNKFDIELTYKDLLTNSIEKVNTVLEFPNYYKGGLNKKDIKLVLYNTLFKFGNAEFSLYTEEN